MRHERRSDEPAVAPRNRVRALLGGLGGGAAAIAFGAVTAFAFWAATDNSNTNVAQSVAELDPAGRDPGRSDHEHAERKHGHDHVLPGEPPRPATRRSPAYSLRRFPAGGGAPSSVSTSCSSSAGTTTCTESSVPDGFWKYTDTPTIGTNWVGPESGKAALSPSTPQRRRWR